ncbi:trace amine-associated receptor 5-like [Dendronephthya gigantea]|uniref:trace amine-associated receptor 5-like n=1 Tax=Dendronephthya gigantea TaxID=151771 RepID=UPI00106BF318|nr:trace amine-associated receptor 5-like [Dendronephthya gigantea]
MTLQVNHTNATQIVNETGTPWITDSELAKLTTTMGRLLSYAKIPLTFITIITILGNTFVLVATYRERSLHQPNKYFIACLAVADLLVGSLLVPLKLYKLDMDNSQRTMSVDYLCRFMIWLDTFALATSIYILTMISFDRYLKISKPLQYKSRMTTSRTRKIIIIILFISTSLAIYSATPNSGSLGILKTGGGRCPIHTDENKVKPFYAFIMISTFFLPVTVILVMYFLIFLVAHKRQKMILNGSLGQTFIVQSQRRALRRDMKVIRMLLVVVGVFIFSWGPWFCWSFLRFYYPKVVEDMNTNSLGYSRYRVNIIEFAAATLPLFNSMCNPIIYACLDQTYREAFKNLFRRMTSRTDSRRQQPSIESRSRRT